MSKQANLIMICNIFIYLFLYACRNIFSSENGQDCYRNAENENKFNVKKCTFVNGVNDSVFFIHITIEGSHFWTLKYHTTLISGRDLCIMITA